MSKIAYLINEFGQWVPQPGIGPDDASAAREKQSPERAVEAANAVAAGAPSAGLVITRAESFPFQDFLSKKIGAAARTRAMEDDRGLSDLALAGVVAGAVASTASQFSETGGRDVSLSPSSAPDSLSDQSGSLQSLLRGQENRERRSFIA